MKRSIEALVVFEMVAVIVAMAIVGLCGVARAEPAQQFAFEVKNPRPGDLSVHLLLRSFDTTGVVPPTPTERSLRLPAGVEVDRAFTGGRWFCDGPALRDALDAHPSGTSFTRRVANLRPFIRELEGSRTKGDQAALANARRCERARIGGGTGVVDARAALPVLVDPIPFHIRQLRIRRGLCLRSTPTGRCTRRQATGASLFSIPGCPASGHLSAQLNSVYPPPTPGLTTTLELPCPRYPS